MLFNLFVVMERLKYVSIVAEPPLPIINERDKPERKYNILLLATQHTIHTEFFKKLGTGNTILYT